MQQVLIHQILLKTDLVNLKSGIDKLDSAKLKNIPNNLSKLKCKEDKFVEKLVPVLVDLSKLSNIVKTMLLKKMYIMLRSNILKIKHLILVI